MAIVGIISVTSDVVHNTMIRNRLGVAAMQYFVVGILVGDDGAAGGGRMAVRWYRRRRD
jgi:hypothetical protein